MAADTFVVEIFDSLCGYVGLEIYRWGRPEPGMWVQRARIVSALRKWADSMDAPEWRDGWTQEIVAAKSFALQIEDGSL